ncbi:hypothetical protein V8F33_009378 [Rhypophila sp. PSN 637]
MLKAVRRSRSHRPLVNVDAVATGQSPAAAGETSRGQDEEGVLGGTASNSILSIEGAHGPTGPYVYKPNAVIPDSVSGSEVHQTGDKPSIIPSKHGQGHVAHGAPPLQIADIPPVRFPDGRNPYLDRPLPLPPPPKSSGTVTTNTPTTTTTASVAAAIPAPLRIARPTMSARPSTSSGPDSSSRTSRLSPENFDRRISRDDMALEVTTQMGMVRTNKGLQPYRIGIKGGALPTPEHSPDAMSLSSSSVPSHGFVPARVMTPESLCSGEIQIGMALGSPSHASFIVGYEAPPQPQSNQPLAAYSPPPLMQPSQPQLQPPPQLQREPTPEPAPIKRQKTQKRRLFGLFGRKNVDPPKAVDVIAASNSSLPLASNASQGWQVDSTPGRSNTVAGKKSAKFIPLITRSGTESDMGVSGPLQQQKSTTAPQLSGPGLLDIEIPDIRLERYSIMFSGVLNQEGGGAGPASSLLARRQATLEKLKTINDRIQDEEDEKLKTTKQYRRATSPQPMNSPVFSLFPATHTRRPSTLAPQVPLTRMRSNTSPALLPSPSKGTFDEDNLLPRKEKKTVTIISPRTMHERNRAANVEKLREQQRAPPQPKPASQPTIITGFRFGPEDSALILDSPMSMSSDGDGDGEPLTPPFDENRSGGGFQPPFPLKPTLAEPHWEMISTPPSDSTSSSESVSSSKRTALPSSPSTSTLSSVQTLPATFTAVADDDDDADLKAAVEISIARQISISRQQRQMLKPVQRSNTIATNNATRRGRSPVLTTMVVNTSGNRSGADDGKRVTITRSMSSPNSIVAATIAGKAAVKDNGRVVETRLGVPRLVEMGLPGSAGNRKSERVVLEGV